MSQDNRTGVGYSSRRGGDDGVGVVELLLGQLGLVDAGVDTGSLDRLDPGFVQPNRHDGAVLGAGDLEPLNDGLGNVSPLNPYDGGLVVDNLLDEGSDDVVHLDAGAVLPLDRHISDRVGIGDVRAGATNPGKDLGTRHRISADGGHRFSSLFFFHQVRNVSVGGASTSRYFSQRSATGTGTGPIFFPRRTRPTPREPTWIASKCL